MDRTWGKLAFGVRYTRGDPAFFWSWTRLMLAGRRVGDVTLHPAISMPHAVAANYLVWAFLESAADSLLFLDDDMEFDHTTVEALRESGREFDVLSALYTTRRAPHVPLVLIGFDRETKKPNRKATFAGIEPVDFVGLGMTLIRRELLERMMTDTRQDGGPFAWAASEGEDGHFCRLAREKYGARLAVNCDVSIGHRVTATARWSNAENKVLIEGSTE